MIIGQIWASSKAAASIAHQLQVQVQVSNKHQQVCEQDTNPPDGVAAAINTMCNILAPFSKGWHIFFTYNGLPWGTTAP